VPTTLKKGANLCKGFLTAYFLIAIAIRKLMKER